jgi:hypothetical protein
LAMPAENQANGHLKANKAKPIPKIMTTLINPAGTGLMPRTTRALVVVR